MQVVKLVNGEHSGKGREAESEKDGKLVSVVS